MANKFHGNVSLSIETKRKYENCLRWGVPFKERMNLSVAKENLGLFYSSSFPAEMKSTLFFGTLLGFIREGNFIEYDEDTDIALLNPTTADLSFVKKHFLNLGFEIFRDNEDLLSAIRKGEYIDIYKFRSNKNPEYSCLNYVIPQEYFLNIDFRKFGDLLLPIPSEPERVLQYLYGPDWIIPVRNFHAPPTHEVPSVSKNRLSLALENTRVHWFYKIKIFLKYNFPGLFSFLKKLNTKIHKRI
jgi:lipopolysaccharide cholinephosphotransferase